MSESIGDGPESARMVAFCAHDVPEIFDATVSPTQIWAEDPYDVETIHAEAREVFGRLLKRATAEPPPQRGRAFLLMGEAGSGKTHLMRAFRFAAHQSGEANFVYLQLTTAASDYGQYILSNLIKSLEHPYFPPQVEDSALQRLSTAVMEAVPGMSPEAAEHFRYGEVPDVAAVVYELADKFLSTPKFADCDEDLIRAMIFLQRGDGRVRTKIIKWLRCEDLSPRDRSFIGELVPRPRPEQATDMIVALGRLMHLAQNAALVLCLDQLEDVFKQDAGNERFIHVVDLLVAFSDAIPTGIVLLSCLEDYYKVHQQRLSRAKLDRLETDPEPVRLVSTRSLPEVKAMAARRLNRLYEVAGLSVDEASTFPFTEAHLRPLERLSSRTVLNWCRAHHERCIVAGGWIEPGGTAAATEPPDEPDTAFDLDHQWNDATSAATALPEGEDALTPLLARAIRRCDAELPAGYKLSTRSAGNLIWVDTTGPGQTRKVVVAIVDGRTVGGSLAKQVAEVGRQANGLPVVLVRSTPFPTSTRTKVAAEIGRVLGRTGRRTEVSDADWRAMAAIESFAEKHRSVPGFADWQRRAKPLSQLRSVQTILDLKSLAENRPGPAPAAAVVPSILPDPLPASVAVVPPVGPVPAPMPDVEIGKTRSVLPVPLFIHPEEIKQHMAFLGGTGSGKTTVAMRIIEHLLARGVCCVLVDRKGDLARYADPAAWEDPGIEHHASHTARRRALRDIVDIDLFTPGSGDRGRPLSLPVVPEHLGQMSTTERQELARFAAESIGGMMLFSSKKEADRSMLAILAKAIEVLAESSDQPPTVTLLRGLIGSMDETLVNAVGGFGAKLYDRLATSLLTLELQYSSLLTDATAERLSLDRMLRRPPGGRPRLTVVNTQFLPSPAAVEFWMSQFLLSVYRWQAKHSSPTLQGVIFLDEADQYLPATRQPATKAPLESLLKRARSAGLGVMLATQSPGDLDYKGRDNVLSWLVGRVTQATAINKLRPMFQASPVDVAAKLPAQETGEFFFIRGGQVTAVKAGMSLVKTEQLPEEKILELASGPGVRH